MSREENYIAMRLEQHRKGILPHHGGKPCPFCTGELSLESSLLKRERELAEVAERKEKESRKAEEFLARREREKVESERLGHSVVEIEFVPCQNYPEGYTSFKEEGRIVLDEKNGQCACSFLGRNESAKQLYESAKQLYESAKQLHDDGCGYFSTSPYWLSMGFACSDTFTATDPSYSHFNGDQCFTLAIGERSLRFRRMVDCLVRTEKSTKTTCNEDVKFINDLGLSIFVSNGVVKRKLVLRATASANSLAAAGIICEPIKGSGWFAEDMSFTLCVTLKYDGYERL